MIHIAVTLIDSLSESEHAEVLRQLKGLGLKKIQELLVVGIVMGYLDKTRIGEIRAIEGVLAVEETPAATDQEDDNH